MVDQRQTDSKKPLDRVQSAQDRTRATYEMLMRQSRDLGRQAIREVNEASQSARQFFTPKSRESIFVDNIDELKKVIAHSHEVIASAKTVLPVVFPDEIILDRAKITVVRREFFWSSDAVSMRIEDVLNVSAAVGPLFGSINISSRVMNSVDHFQVQSFWRADALRLKQIIQGYLIARQNGVQTDHLSCEELAKVLYETGSDR